MVHKRRIRRRSIRRRSYRKRSHSLIYRFGFVIVGLLLTVVLSALFVPSLLGDITPVPTPTLTPTAVPTATPTPWDGGGATPTATPTLLRNQLLCIMECNLGRIHHRLDLPLFKVSKVMVKK